MHETGEIYSLDIMLKYKMDVTKRRKQAIVQRFFGTPTLGAIVQGSCANPDGMGTLLLYSEIHIKYAYTIAGIKSTRFRICSKSKITLRNDLIKI
ncbi:hypothetical protein XELAEV_18044695mg [Xenopus laevis]|uniref:Uncharacterized protein n=1 Tax=Xenopus laevis TaxID=8355 RepID=A0A974BZ17_XENLA|nr:hypothetical protein XELAEV_18044695mg [Xenopus laevis]